MEVRWSQRSLKKVLKISEFISEDSKKRALKFITELTNSVDRLKDFPESGPVIIENPAFRQITFKKLRLKNAESFTG